MPSASRILFVALLFCASAMGLLAAKKPKNEPDVLIDADNFCHDAQLLRPSATHPIHYIILGGQQGDLGSSVAGEKMPPPSDLESLIDRTLGAQRFTKTQVGGPMPQIVIVYSFGSAYLETEEFSEDEYDAGTGEYTGTSTTTTTFNGREFLGLAGATKVRGKMLSSAVAEGINDAIQSGRLYITVSALDASALRRQKKQIVWRTRISIPSRGHRLPEAMEVMLASAGPCFGADSDMPVILRPEDERKTEVQIGEATVVDEP